jgi:hypothetical protein
VADVGVNMSTEIVPPKERTCEKCGRMDVWDSETENWVIAEEDGERQIGNRHCIHEWDINGQYNPVAGKADVDADTDADA